MFSLLQLTTIIFMIFRFSGGLQERGSYCPQMFKRTYEGYIPKGNKTAGTYILMDSVTDFEDCITKCCENSTCNAAIMFNKECYTVDCESNENCLPILHHNTSLRRNISMVLVRPERKYERWSKILKSQEHSGRINWKQLCPKVYEFTYKGYLPWGNITAGNYSYIEEISDLKECTVNCCNNDDCHVAILNDKKCYNVQCETSRLCVPSLYHNSTVRKSLYMILVKPVDRSDEWVDILKNFNESQEILPEISSSEENRTVVSNIEKNVHISLRLSKVEVKPNETFYLEWQQLEGPKKLEFLERNKTVFDIKTVIRGEYIIKLIVKNNNTETSIKKNETIEYATKNEETTNSSNRENV